MASYKTARSMMKKAEEAIDAWRDGAIASPYLGAARARIALWHIQRSKSAKAPALRALYRVQAMVMARQVLDCPDSTPQERSDAGRIISDLKGE